jgi:peptidoglycan/xylan/chitin deacetylase (PgdA/CDA1 family)
LTIGAPTLILGYRRINEGVDDPFHFCVTPERFVEQLEGLSRRVEFVTLDEVSRPSRTPRVALTFDGGYVDNLVQAVPIAQRFGAPITVYVTSGLVGDPRGFWWDRLARLVLHGASEPVEVAIVIGGVEIPAWFGRPETARSMLEVLWTRLRVRTPQEIDDVLVDLGERLSVSTEASPDARTLTGLELDNLAASAGVTIGAQTADHILLRARNYPVQVATIRASKLDLEAQLGGSVRHFAYPFGGRDSFNADSISAVRSAGFETATTTMPGSVEVSSIPLALPRRMVMNWSGRLFRLKTLRWGLL